MIVIQDDSASFHQKFRVVCHILAIVWVQNTAF